MDVEEIKHKLSRHHISFVASRDIPGQTGQSASFFACRTASNPSPFLVELKFKAGMKICKVTIRSPSKGLSELCRVTLARLVL